MDFRDKKILVAGGTGLVGANLAKRLASLEAKVRATWHKRGPHKEILLPNVEIVHCDLTKPEDCEGVVEGMDYVFMCAANTSGAGIITKTPLVHVTPNVLMNTLMLEAAYRAKVKKFIFISTTVGYPPSGDKPVWEEEMFNGDPYEDYFFVGWMKRFTEKLCQMYCEKLKEPMMTIVLRGSNFYGPHANFGPEESHVVAALIRKVVERHDPIEVWGTGDDVRDLIYIDDFVDAMLLAIEKLESLNIGCGRGYSVKQVLQTILDIEGYHPRIVFNPSKPSTMPKRYVDTSKAEAILGFKAKTPLREGIRKTIQWYRENG